MIAPSALRALGPHAVGLETDELEITDIEGARLLANDARPVLTKAGFNDDEVRDWAEAYFVRHHEGDVGELVSWISRCEAARGLLRGSQPRLPG